MSRPSPAIRSGRVSCIEGCYSSCVLFSSPKLFSFRRRKNVRFRSIVFEKWSQYVLSLWSEEHHSFMGMMQGLVMHRPVQPNVTHSFDVAGAHDQYFAWPHPGQPL